MAVSVKLAGVSVTHISRDGPVGSAGTRYSGSVNFHVTGDGLEFQYRHQFDRVSDIDVAVNAAAQSLAKTLREMAQEVQMFHPGP